MKRLFRKLFGKKQKMKNFIVVFESGCILGGDKKYNHIMKRSVIVQADELDKAIHLAHMKLRDCSILHYGHKSEYCTIVDIKEVK